MAISGLESSGAGAMSSVPEAELELVPEAVLEVVLEAELELEPEAVLEVVLEAELEVVLEAELEGEVEAVPVLVAEILSWAQAGDKLTIRANANRPVSSRQPGAKEINPD